MKLPFLAFALTAATAFAHQHFAAGFVDSNSNGKPDAGEPLRLVNAPAAGTYFHMVLRPDAQRYAGYLSLDDQPRTEHPDDYFTFTVLSDGQAEVADARHPATGSYIGMEITSVSGPDGGSFGFWDIDPSNPDLGWSYTHTTPTISFEANEPTGAHRFVLSEPLALPVNAGEDPYGHIHNRGFTVDAPGIYIVGFTLVDLSTNGPGGGAIHTPSETYYFTFVAGVPDPTPTPTPTPQPDRPSIRIIGGSTRTVNTASAVLQGTATAPAGLAAVQIKTRGAFRTIGRQENWKTTLRLNRGMNRVQVRAMDSLGRASAVQQVRIRRR